MERWDETRLGEWGARLRRGDTAAFRALYDALAGPVFALARRRLGGDRAAAEDVVQDVFTRLWQRRAQWDPARGRFTSWVFVLTRHAIADHRVRTRRDPLSLDDDLLDLVAQEDRDDNPLEAVEAAESVRIMLEALPPEQADILRLVYVEGLSTREAACRLQIPHGTAKSRLRLAAGRLRRQFPEGVV